MEKAVNVKKGKAKKGNKIVWLMLAPSLFFLLVVSIYPFCWLFQYITYDYNGFTKYYTGLANIKRVFTDTLYWQSVGHTFEYAFLKLILVMPLSLATAVMLSRKLRGSNLLRGIFFLPTVISSAVYCLIFYFIFAAYNGVLNSSLKALGIINQPIDWLGDSTTAMLSAVIVAVWGGFGNYMILFSSGLTSIPEDVYESAKIDGANGLQTFFKVTLPLLGPVLKVVLMLAITTALKDYQSIMVLTGGGPNNSTQVMFLYIYQLCFGNTASSTSLQIGYGAVLSIVSAFIVGTVTLVYLKLSKKLDDIY
ncbi:MAG: sugar ABC transporter permease [Anaerocolumna sp.]